MKSLSVLAVIALALSLAGCRDDDDYNQRDPMIHLSAASTVRCDDDSANYGTVTGSMESTDTGTGIVTKKVVVKRDDGYFFAVVQPAGMSDFPNGTKVQLCELNYTDDGGNYNNHYQRILIPSKK